MSADYKYYDFQIYEYLIRLEQQLKGVEELPEIKRWKALIDEERQRIKNRKFRVAVVGEFRKGKSSFINALLGKEILPVDALPTTATINRITYGPVPKAYLQYKDGNVQAVPIENLSQYVTKLTSESQGYAALIEEAVVEYPSIFCQNYVDLIDTPGMNDDAGMNAVTLNQLEQIDLAIVAISVSNPFSDTESSFVAKLLESEEICQIVVVVTKIDQIREREKERLLDYLSERIPQKVLEKLKETHEDGDPVFQKYEMIFHHVPIFGVCSLDALEARKHNDEEQFARSGFQELNEKLPQLILTSQNNSAILKAIRTIKKITAEYKLSKTSITGSILKKKEELEQQKYEFTQMVNKLTDGMLSDTKLKLFVTIDGFSAAEEEIRKNFIARLTSIRVLDADIIEQELNSQADESLLHINHKIREDLENALNQCWQEETRQQFCEIVRMLLAFLQMMPNRINEAEEQLNRLLLHPQPFPMERDETLFSWTKPPVPDYDQLLDGDIILKIRQAVAGSLEDYCRERRRKMEKLLGAACEEAGARLDPAVELVIQGLDERINWWGVQEKRLTGKEMDEGLAQLEQENDALEKQFTEQFIYHSNMETDRGGETYEQ